VIVSRLVITLSKLAAWAALGITIPPGAFKSGANLANSVVADNHGMPQNR
jgi:hypothetical protein